MNFSKAPVKEQKKRILPQIKALRISAETYGNTVKSLQDVPLRSQSTGT